MSVHLNDFKPTEERVRASLLPPEEVRSFVNPVEDDTWLRQTNLVPLEELRAAEGDEVAAKRELLREFTASGRGSLAPSTSATKEVMGSFGAEAAAIEDVARQEQFLEDYKRRKAHEDKSRALGYKQRMLEDFRIKRSSASRAEAEL